MNCKKTEQYWEVEEFSSSSDYENANSTAYGDASLSDSDGDIAELNDVDERGNLVFERHAKVAILGSPETAKQILNDLNETSPSASS